MVDYDDLIVECGSKLRVFLSIDADVGPQVVAASNFLPPITKCRSIKRHAASDDCNEAPSGP
jgi:hypothetical protein